MVQWMRLGLASIVSLFSGCWQCEGSKCKPLALLWMRICLIK